MLLTPKSRWQEEPVGNAYILRSRAVVARHPHKVEVVRSNRTSRNQQLVRKFY